jgi:hypothetical protein
MPDTVFGIFRITDLIPDKHQLIERRLERRLTDTFLNHIDSLEHGQVHLAPLIRSHIPIYLLGSIHECHCALDEIGTGTETAFGPIELLLNSHPLPGDLLQAIVDLRRGDLAISHQINQVFLFGVEPEQLCRQLLVEEPC